MKKGGMISENMGAPGNMPQNVVRKSYSTGSEITYDYQDSAEAMYNQEMSDIMVANRSKAKRRY